MENHTSGIPRLSALLNSNESFCNYRIFGPEVARILLIKQIGLNQLAEQLQELDEADDANLDMEYRCKSIEHIEGWDSAQRDLLNQIEVKINVYCKLLKCRSII